LRIIFQGDFFVSFHAEAAGFALSGASSTGKREARKPELGPGRNGPLQAQSSDRGIRRSGAYGKERDMGAAKKSEGEMKKRLAISKRVCYYKEAVQKMQDTRP